MWALHNSGGCYVKLGCKHEAGVAHGEQVATATISITRANP